MKAELRPYLLLIILVIVIDQISKLFIYSTFVPGQSKEVLGNFLRFTFVYNPGGAFGITIGNIWIFSLVSLLAVIIIIQYFIRVPQNSKIAKICLAFVVGGACGNLIDRIIYGRVIDFIDVNIIDIVIPPFRFLFFQFPGFDLYRWYIFNVADAAITLGLIGFIIFMLIQDREKPPAETESIDKNKPYEQSNLKTDSSGERDR